MVTQGTMPKARGRHATSAKALLQKGDLQRQNPKMFPAGLNSDFGFRASSGPGSLLLQQRLTKQGR
jgi:hypothetical protein